MQPECLCLPNDPVELIVGFAVVPVIILLGYSVIDYYWDDFVENIKNRVKKGE